MSLNAATVTGPENHPTAKRVNLISKKYIYFECYITNVVSISLLPVPGIHRQWQSDAYGQHGMNLLLCNNNDHPPTRVNKWIVYNFAGLLRLSTLRQESDQ